MADIEGGPNNRRASMLLFDLTAPIPGTPLPFGGTRYIDGSTPATTANEAGMLMFVNKANDTLPVAPFTVADLKTWLTQAGRSGVLLLSDDAGGGAKGIYVAGDVIASGNIVGASVAIDGTDAIQWIIDKDNIGAEVDLWLKFRKGAGGDEHLKWDTATHKFQFSTELSMQTHKIIDVVDPVAAQDVATKNYVDTADGTAIHDNIANEINGIAEKGAPVAGDFIVIEDSADGWNKKKAQVGNIGVTDHGALGGLNDNDHGVIYYTQAEIDALISDAAYGAGWNGVGAIAPSKNAIFDMFDDHSARHELAGADVISVVGLSGLLADDQHVLDAEVTALMEAGITIKNGNKIQVNSLGDDKNIQLFHDDTQGILHSSYPIWIRTADTSLTLRHSTYGAAKALSFGGDNWYPSVGSCVLGNTTNPWFGLSVKGDGYFRDTTNPATEYLKFEHNANDGLITSALGKIKLHATSIECKNVADDDFVDILANAFTESSAPLPKDSVFVDIENIHNLEDGSIDHGSFPSYIKKNSGLDIGAQCKMLIRGMQELVVENADLKTRLESVENKLSAIQEV